MSTSDGSSADYYVLPPDSKQLQDLISHKDMNAQIGEIFRACYRYGEASHSGKLRDAKKMRFYAQAEIERLEKLEVAINSKPAGIKRMMCSTGDRIVIDMNSTYCIHNTHIDSKCKLCNLEVAQHDHANS